MPSLCAATCDVTRAKLARMCGIRDFSLTDLVTPEPKRTLFILSAIINFERFRQDRLSHFARYQQEAEDLAEARSEAEGRHQQVRCRACLRPNFSFSVRI
jgi:kinetochore protein Nuf2